MNYTESRKNIPNTILDLLDGANIFYSDIYEKYTHERNEKIYYFWDSGFIVMLRVKEVLFLKGGVFDSEPYCLVGEAKEIEQKNFINEVCNMLKRLNITWVVTAQSASFTTYPNNAVVVPRGNLIVDLTNSIEDLFKKVHSKHRNSIRRAEKYGVNIVYENSAFKEYSEIDAATYKRSKKSGSSTKYFERISKFMNDNFCFAFAKYNNENQAGGVFFFNKRMAYYMHGGSIAKPEPGSANLLIWKVMCYLKNKNISSFNFVGYGLDIEKNSKYEGIQKFKERFGGDLLKCYNFKFISNKRFYFLYRVAMSIKNKQITKLYEDELDIKSRKYPECNIFK